MIDGTGMYVLPGLVDLHLHTGGVPKAPEAEYYYKIWMAHGITTGRGVPFGDLTWSLNEKQRSAKNEITAPRMWSYHRPGSGWNQGPVRTPEQARAYVRWLKQQGGDGLKLNAERPAVMAALLDEAKKLGLGSTAHLAQTGVANMNALDAARLGLGTVTHFYGLFEALYEDQVTSEELTRMYLSRLERHGPRLECVVTLTKERALEEARRADAHLDQGRYCGPLHGIPWGAKDLLAARGYRTTWGATEIALI